MLLSVNTGRTPSSTEGAVCRNRICFHKGFAQFLGLALGLLYLGFARGGEPLSVCAVPALSSGGLTLLLDPVELTPIALLSDPDARLPLNRWPMVLQTVQDNPGAAGLPLVRLTDALPEFWAQPASWMSFVRGPEAYSGLGTEVRARDWAGMPATDRRSYRLDPGLKPDPTPNSSTPPGGGLMRVQVSPGSLRLAWNGLAGRVYQVQYTTDLRRPFQSVQTLIASEDGEAQVALPISDSQGFFRLVEIAP
jgi:hypothetical protein